MAKNNSGMWSAAVKGFQKGRLGKNEHNMKKFQAKKERGPVKTLFHITRNENVDNIMNQGLQANPAGKPMQRILAKHFMQCLMSVRWIVYLMRTTQRGKML